MDTNNVVWIVIAAVVALLAVGVVVFLARRARNQRRAQEADRIREEVHHDSRRVQRQASIVEETEARARAAQAEAEAKAAEAARLAETASSRRDALNSSQQHLDARREHADSLDPHHTGHDKGGAAAPDHKNPVGDEQPRRDGQAETMRPDVRTRST